MIDSNMRLITNRNGRFYAGMTQEEAKENGTYKMFIRRDFRKLDTNGDGVLSVNEIINERNRSAKSNRNWAAFWGISGLLDIVLDRPQKGWMIADIIIAGVMVAFELSEAKKTDEGTKRIEEMLRNDENGQVLNYNG